MSQSCAPRAGNFTDLPVVRVRRFISCLEMRAVHTLFMWPETLKKHAIKHSKLDSGTEHLDLVDLMGRTRKPNNKA